MKNEFKVAIVGCGSIAQLHSACLESMPDITVAATVDIKQERAEAMAAKHGAAAYTDLTDMLREVRPDAVHICTPHYLHAAQALEAARSGAYVFTEKPPAMNRSQWALLEEADRLSGVGVCFQNRYNRNVRELQKEMAQGLYGRVKGGRATVYWERGEDYYSDDWHGTWALEGGGVLINQAIHTLDLLNLLMGGTPGKTEASFGNRHLKGIAEVEDTLEAYIDYDGKPGIFYATTAYSSNAPVLIELDCEEARVQLLGSELLVFRPGQRTEVRDLLNETASGFKDYWGSGHAACIEDFYRAIGSGEAAPIGLKDIAGTMDLVYRIYESCGRPAAADMPEPVKETVR